MRAQFLARVPSFWHPSFSENSQLVTRSGWVEVARTHRVRSRSGREDHAGAPGGLYPELRLTMITDWELACYDEFAAKKWALNSAVECHPHTVEVVGSNPTAPTIFNLRIRTFTGAES